MGHYASEMGYDRHEEEVQLKKKIIESLDNLSAFVVNSHTSGIRHEVESIRKYYKSVLYDLRYINIDS